MTTNNKFMKEALKQAKEAYKKNEIPVGAIIVKDGKILARGRNLKEKNQDPTLHAEICAIKKASKKVGWRLSDCEMYVTLEPCIMCAGAIVNARIKKLYIGATDPKAGGAGSLVDVFNIKGLNHKVEVIYGIMEQECSSILKDFFKQIRNNNVYFSKTGEKI